MTRWKWILVSLLVIVPVQAQELPKNLQGLGLRESTMASRDMPGWSAPKKILVRSFFGQDIAAMLQPMVPDVKLVAVATVAEAAANASGAQALFGFCERSIFEAADSMHWVQAYFAGVEDCVSLPAMQGGMVLTNGQRLSSPTIADHTMALTYGLVRGLDLFQKAQAQSKWNMQAAPSLQSFGELSGRTMLVVGLGGIGTQVARRAHALGMTVLATRGSRREGPDYIEYVGLGHEAIHLAKKADVVVNAAPLTDATRGMFNKEFFTAMKPTAYFVSVGRGQSTVTADLIAAINSQQIAGAALDVVDPEPLPADHPIWSTPRVIVTPHVAALSAETWQRIWALVGENLRRYVAGEPLLSVVGIERGY